MVQVRRIGEEALLVHNFAAAVTGGTGGGAGARLGARCLAAVARLHARDLDFGADAEDRVLEADLQIVADVFAALRPIAPALAAPTE